jgi:hypothetical protein
LVDQLSLGRIAELERELQAELDAQAEASGLTPLVRAKAREWSEAVWALSQSQGPPMLAPSDLERGLELARRPVFVCGVARSGTTLLRDLLDGHPELVVIPTESGYFTDMEPALFARPSADHAAFLGRQWLERLVFPPPRWLLGRSEPGRSPYVEFARELAAWWQVPERHREARIGAWPLAGLALAYGRQLGEGRLPARSRMWVEKTLTSERFLHRIRHDFPEAKVLHIVRHPAAVFASLKALVGERWSYRHAAWATLRFLAPSYRLAASGGADMAPGHYRLVRYEELAAGPELKMHEVAEFLGLAPSPALAVPTVGGRPASSNSSFREARPDPLQSLDRLERAMLALGVGRAARRLGYSLDRP